MKFWDKYKQRLLKNYASEVKGGSDDSKGGFQHQLLFPEVKSMNEL